MMIEKIVLDYLSSKLDVPVLMEEPEQKEKRYVLLEKTGSGRKNYIWNATIAIQSYGPSLYEAAELNESVKRAMKDIVGLDQICACEINSDYNFTDPETHRYRYQAVFELVHY